jgi:two-component system CheB/CheR fusion protein
MNDEQQGRATELDRMNLFLEGILGNLGVGVVVLDEEGRVQVWNASSTDLWGLRPEEVDGEPFALLDMGLPVGELEDSIRAAVEDGDESERTLDAITRRGKKFDCYVRVLPLRKDGDDIFGAIVLMADRELSGILTG